MPAAAPKSPPPAADGAQGAPHETPPASSSTGTSFLSKLRGQAGAALAKLPSSTGELEQTLRQAAVTANPRQSSHTLRAQLAIKAAKGVIVDHDSLARENKAFSKTILDWTKEPNHATGTDNSDIIDIGDRLAWLTYKTGELHAAHAKSLETSRGYLKDIRNSEVALTQQRDRRLHLSQQLGKLRANSKPDTAKINGLQAELDEITRENSPLANAEVAAMTKRREKLKAAFEAQFAATLELGEHLAITARYGQALIQNFDVSASAGKTDYSGVAYSAAIRSELERELHAWSPQQTRTPLPKISASTAAPGTSSYAPSFSESHANELASIPADPLEHHADALDSYYSSQPAAVGGSRFSATPPPQHPTTPRAPLQPSNSLNASPIPIPERHSSSQSDIHTSASPLVAGLNHDPAPQLPHSSSSGISPSPALRDVHADPSVPTEDPFSDPTHAPGGGLPTVAETGSPILGTGGPKTGTLPTRTKSEEVREAKEAQEELERARERIRATESGGAEGSHAGAGLDREFSLRGRQGGELLPAYSVEQGQTHAQP